MGSCINDTIKCVALYCISMAEKTLSEIVEACNQMTTEELAEPSLESENAYKSEPDYEPTQEQEDSIDRIVNED